jgi:hypothetical protein
MNTLKIFCVVIVACSLAMTAATAQTLPCFLSQVQIASRPEPSEVSGGPLYDLVATAMVSYRSDCRSTTYDANAGSLAIHPLYVMERRNSETGIYEAIRSFAISISFDGSGKSRRQAAFETSLPRGSYRVRSFDGTELLESLPFAAGSTIGDFAPVLPFVKPLPQDDRLALAYGQPSAIVRSGAIYFRGMIPEGQVASGYLYQDQSDGTTAVVPMQFEQLDASAIVAIFNVLPPLNELGWMRVKLSSQIGIGTFDAGLPITGCIKSGAGTTCFSIFDPAVPNRDVDINKAPFGAGFGR